MEKDILIQALYDYNIVLNKPEGIVLKSGKSSDVYINLRGIGHCMGLFSMVIAGLSNIVVNLARGYDISNYKNLPTIIGIPTMGVSLAAVVAYNSVLPFSVIRQKEKTHGISNKIEGDLTGHIILIDDVITSGTSVNETIDLIQPVYESKPYRFDVVTIVDRQDHSLENVHSLVTLDEILKGR